VFIVWYRRCQYLINLNGGVIVGVLASSGRLCGFEPRSGQTKEYEFGICCFSDKHTALRRKSKDWLARNQNIVSEWKDMSISDCCFCDYKNQTKCVGLIQSGPHHHLIEN
jgi:hypothetical protein